MKRLSLLFVILFSGFPTSFCAQPAGEEDVFRKEADHTLQESQFRPSRSRPPLWRSASSPSASSENADEKQFQNAVGFPSDDGSRELNHDGDNGAAGKGGDKVSEDELRDSSFREGVEATALHGGVLGGSGAHRPASTEAGAADSVVRERLDSLGSEMSISDKDRVAPEATGVPSFVERMGAVMQSLATADLFSVLRHYEDALAPMNFAGPRVTTRLDENSCVVEVNLEHLPETASLSVSVEGGQVFVEYASSSQEISVEQETYAGRSNSAKDELANEESGTFGTTTFPGYSVGHAGVFSLETFQVPSTCDHESGMAKAARVGRDKLLIKFPRLKGSGNAELPVQAATSESGASRASSALPGSPGVTQESYTDGKDTTSAPESMWDAGLPFARRFMQQNNRAKSAGKPAGFGGFSHEKPNDEGKSSAERTWRRRYIPFVEADAL